ncbi:hypothetical protein cypCar_00002818 [Cyprinus carpio]|nr:hypothetical protein cypCar_00002818 [Cyprinus carpio]
MKDKWYKTESIVMSHDFESPDIKCCASNLLGEECTELHHLDLNRNVDGQKAQTIFLKSGQSLLLQCTMKSQSIDVPELRWQFNNTAVKGITSLYFKNWAEYFFIESVNVTHSGEYICTSKNNQAGKTYVKVLENDKIDILQLNENNTILAQNKASFCFQALVFSFPKAQCHWITPNQTQIECRETHYPNCNSAFKLCNPEPGQYQMKLKTQQTSVIRNMSLCISDIPKIAIKFLNDSNIVSCETQSSLPATVSWKICPSYPKCIHSENWKEIPVAKPNVMDSDQFCQKKIDFARHHSNSEDHHIKCCITNTAGTRCSEQLQLPTNILSIDYVICFLVIFILLMVIFALIIFIRVKIFLFVCCFLKSTGPIYLIFQYCCNGDLLNYLKGNRERFHKYLTDAFNRDRFRGLYHNFQQKRNSSEYIEPESNQYVHMTLATKGQENEALLSPSISSVSTVEEMLECEDKHQEEELHSLTYDDLLSFSFQVAKGMEFLSSKNLYYNVGGYCHNDVTYQNAPMTPDATLMEKKTDVFQSDTENSDERKAVDSPGSVRTEPLV